MEIEEIVLEPYIWHEAEVTFPDYAGTAQLDHKMTGESAFAAAGIDEDKWLVVGLDIGGGEHSHGLHIVAVDLDAVPPGGGNVLDRLMEEYGHIPTTDFLLHDVDPYEFLKSITHHFDLRLRVRGTSDKTIMVTSLGDIPEQP
ncbi:hypothetical protein SAMN04489740_4107 [Arthrobacter alpinus]|uniref:Uncharacterized protein n=2 Tax=Arthrobacter alpinus TaxID=656366 RepID=A0A1H5PCH5_9MICC|nr:hypothetical protein SAMN04489740_4107 [Arthrobacter alpinus]